MKFCASDQVIRDTREHQNLDAPFRQTFAKVEGQICAA
jgi:hypothetical protein